MQSYLTIVLCTPHKCFGTAKESDGFDDLMRDAEIIRHRELAEPENVDTFREVDRDNTPAATDQVNVELAGTTSTHLKTQQSLAPLELKTKNQKPKKTGKRKRGSRGRRLNAKKTDETKPQADNTGVRPARYWGDKSHWRTNPTKRQGRPRNGHMNSMDDRGKTTFSKEYYKNRGNKRFTAWGAQRKGTQ